MTSIVKVIGVLGFVICLLVMYTTNHGIRGIQTFDPSFRLLDMRFHYNSEIVKHTFKQISEGGRIAYKKYLLLDFIFIGCFLITMITVSDILSLSQPIKATLYIVCVLRALLDIFENILLFYMLGQYPEINDSLATICSWITTFKFIMLYIWFTSIAIQTVILGVNSVKRYI